MPPKYFHIAFAISSTFFISCSEKDKQTKQNDYRNSYARVLAREIKQKQIDAKKDAINQAKIAKARLEEKAELLAIRIEEEQAAAEKLAEEKLEAELAEITRKQKEQKQAWTKYIGTKYETIILNGGKTLKDAKASEVRATHVTFIHSTGIANVKFKDLNYSIRKACKYDPELAVLSRKKQAELQRQIKSRLAVEAALDIKKEKPVTSKRTTKKRTTTKPRVRKTSRSKLSAPS